MSSKLSAWVESPVVDRIVRNAADAAPYDVLGIGFGPSNLALAIVVQEAREAGLDTSTRSLFLESKPAFGWHPGLMLDGARVQLSFLKDLATLRDPRSRFTFLTYLKQKGRLADFANLRNFHPTRVEFNDYYSWAASQVEDQVRYGREVVSVDVVPSPPGAPVELLRLVVKDLEHDKLEAFTTRSLVVATGGVPRTPPGIDISASKRTLHTQDFLFRLERDFPDHEKAYRFVVVGSGQSAAEVFQYLMGRYPKAKVTAAIRRFAFKPADDSHFVNEIFHPEVIDFLFSLSDQKRMRVLESHMDTNYSAVDLDLIQEIYEALYQQKVRGENRAEIKPFLELKELKDTAHGTVHLSFHDRIHDEIVAMEADGAVLATGFDRPKQHPLLAKIHPYLQLADDGRYKVDRYYQIEARQNFLPRVFLQGFCETTHGLSDTLLSILPLRSEEIYRAVTAVEDREPVLQGIAV